APNLRAVAAIEREKIAFGIAGEHQVASRSENRRKQDVLIWIAPGFLTGDRVPRVQMAIGCAPRRELEIHGAVHEITSFSRFVRGRVQAVTDFINRRIQETCTWGVGGRVPALCAGGAGAKIRSLAELGFVAADQLARLGNAGNPVANLWSRED